MFIVRDSKGNKIKWDDGKFYSENSELLKKIRDYGRKLSEYGCGVTLNGTSLAAFKNIDYEKSKYTAYALLDSFLDIKVADGDVPSAAELYPKDKKSGKNTVY